MTSFRQKLGAVGASVLVNGGFLFAVAGLAAKPPPMVVEAPVFEVALEDFPVAAQAKAPAPPAESQPAQPQAAPPPPAASSPPPVPSVTPAQPVEPRPISPATGPSTSETARPSPDPAKGTQGTASVRPSQNAPAAAAPSAPQAAAVGRPTGSYAAQLRRHIEGFKVYPRQAKRRRIEGEVTVAFTMDRQGRVLSSRIQKGSGSPELDQAALDMLEAAQPLPRPPADVPGDKLAMTYATTFSLED